MRTVFLSFLIPVLFLLVVKCSKTESNSISVDGGPTSAVLVGDDRFINTDRSTLFVGDEACQVCHAEVYEKYQTNSMAQSLYTYTPDRVIEKYPGNEVFDPNLDLYYRAYREGDRFFQEEYRKNGAGEKIHSLVREMNFVIGGGTAARAYLTVNNSRHYQLPLAWYTQENTWRFNPGFEKINLRFSREIPDRCMICHNGYPVPQEFVPGKFTSIPEGISCERCHGPGSIHVAAHDVDSQKSGRIDSTIVNPAHLSLDLRLDVCQQCHFPGAISFIRENENPYSFRPGRPMSSHVFLFVKDDPDITKVGVDSHPERMKMSACFKELLAQGDPMDCMTCHDAHEGYKSQGRKHFNDTCISCHNSESVKSIPNHQSNADCVSCHMPRVGADGAPHAAFTDHFVRVIRSSESQASNTSDVIELKTHFSVQQGTELESVYEGMAYVIYGDQNQNLWSVNHGIDLLSKSLDKTTAFGEAYYVLGFAHLKRGRYEMALPWLKKSVELNPGIPERLNSLAQAYENTNGNASEIERLYRQALSIQPALAEIRVNYGRFLESQERLQDAIAQYLAAIEEDSWLEEAQFNLGTAYLRSGDTSSGEKHLLEAVKLNPDHVKALSNLGILYAGQAKENIAKAYFDRAVEADPSNPEALGNLATYHINRNELLPASRLLERAVEVDTQNAGFLGTLAAIHFNLGNVVLARNYAQKALQIDPTNVLANQVLSQQ